METVWSTYSVIASPDITDCNPGSSQNYPRTIRLLQLYGFGSPGQPSLGSMPLAFAEVCYKKPLY